jgi:hypothetical protein
MGVDKHDKARIHIGVSAFCCSIWTCQNNLVFDKHNGTIFFEGYPTSCALDTVMVPTSPEGSVGPHSYWVQLAVEGRT